MYANPLSGSGSAFLAAPVLFVQAFLLYFYLDRASRKRRKARGKKISGFTPSTFVLGISLQHLEMFTHPSVEHWIQEKLEDQAEEDGEGDPDDPDAHLNRQLRQIRLGEPVDRLVTRIR